MTNLGTKMCCVVLICVQPILSYSQSKSKLPTQKSLESAVELADEALKNYQKTLGLLRADPLVAETLHTDEEPIVFGGMAIILLRTKASRDGTVDRLELATLFANVDAAAINASLTVGTLALKIPTVDVKNAEQVLKSLNVLIAAAQQLKSASDALWEILEACLASEQPLQLTGASNDNQPK